jgi:hypothetical protein
MDLSQPPQSPNAMPMAIEREWEGFRDCKQRILIGQSVPPTLIGMACERLELWARRLQLVSIDMVFWD